MRNEKFIWLLHRMEAYHANSGFPPHLLNQNLLEGGAPTKFWSHSREFGMVMLENQCFRVQKLEKLLVFWNGTDKKHKVALSCGAITHEHEFPPSAIVNRQPHQTERPRHHAAGATVHLVTSFRQLTATVVCIHSALMAVYNNTGIPFTWGLIKTIERLTETEWITVRENARSSLIIPTPNTTGQTLRSGVLVSCLLTKEAVGILRQLSGNVFLFLNWFHFLHCPAVPVLLWIIDFVFAFHILVSAQE